MRWKSLSLVSALAAASVIGLVKCNGSSPAMEADGGSGADSSTGADGGANNEGGANGDAGDDAGDSGACPTPPGGGACDIYPPCGCSAASNCVRMRPERQRSEELHERRGLQARARVCARHLQSAVREDVRLPE
jgi:hypothetical protein